MAATEGYPRTLPSDSLGDPLPNTWAFFPAFPFAAGALSRATGLEFVFAALVVNVLAGAAAALLLAVLARRVGGDEVGWWAVALWTFWPAAFVLQVPYAEAIYLALAAGSLLALVAGRHLLAAMLIVAASFSRGYVLALSAAALCRVMLDLRTSRRLTARTGILIIAAVAAPFLWMAVAAVVTGRLDAYAATQQAWGFSFDPAVALERWSRGLGSIGRDGYVTAVVFTLLLAVVAAIAACRPFVPIELRVYTLVSVCFLLAIAQPGAVAFGSVPRFAFGILTLPIVGAMLLPNAFRWPVLMLLAALQYLWIHAIWSGLRGIAP
jgi:hypothetical protein